MHIWQNLGLSFFQPKNLNRQILTDDHDIYSHDKLHRVTCCNILSALRAVVALSLSSHDFPVLFFQKLVENDDIFTSQTPQGNLLTILPHIESCCDGFLVQQGLSSFVFPKSCWKRWHIHKSNSTGQLVDSSSSHWELLWWFPRPTRTKTKSDEAPRLVRISTESDFLRRKWL